MLATLTRRQKRLIYLFGDVLIVPVALYGAFCLRFGTSLPIEQIGGSWPLFLILTALAPVIFFTLRLPWIKLAVLDATAVLRIVGAASILAVSAICISYLAVWGSPRSVPLIFAALFLALALIARNLAVLIFYRGQSGVPVAIYGAGDAGLQLVLALRQAREVNPVVFVDDNPALRDMIVSGLKVCPPSELQGLVDDGTVQRVLLAMPSLPTSKRVALVDELSGLGCDVQVLPSFVDLIAGKTGQLRTVSPDELLGRDKVNLDRPEIAKAYAGRVVMVTGAGGSIGSELCRQLLDCRPARIVLFEQSEFALYEIDRDLRPLAQQAGIAVTTRLGSVTNAARVANVMADDGVEIVLHAAAYKHVPLVEDNELEGARNNILGTRVVAEAAIAQGVERFILISTDKAVRPTNIMGATKRMAELVIQDLQTRSDTTRFAMVRFGNVLGSSGSVLPLFQKQIRAGGPVTVTHPEVTRFFMTIPEAARLVLLAGAYAAGGDVFVLDMGQPMKIVDIARRMIEMSGTQVKANDSEDGIEIQITGLRPGEKLYEELLIDDDSLIATPHEKIMRAEELRLSQIEVAGMLNDIQKALAMGDKAMLRRAVRDYVQGYHIAQIVPVA
ncbi:MAG: nucleoside-diphosphate sugar epimerase/dehydratase [Pseudomonadota bacterium]